MNIRTSDGFFTVGDSDAADNSDVFAGRAPIAGDPAKMGQFIQAVLSERSETAAQ